MRLQGILTELIISIPILIGILLVFGGYSFLGIIYTLFGFIFEYKYLTKWGLI